MPRRKNEMGLPPKARTLIQYLVMNRWETGGITEEIRAGIGITASQVTNWRKKEVFQDELRRQIELYRSNFDDIRMADRKERVLELERLYTAVPDQRVSLKVKLLQAIRQEVGDDKPSQLHLHKHEAAPIQGPNIPPRAQSYEEWIEQNEKAEAAAAAQAKAIEPKQLAPAKPQEPINGNGQHDLTGDAGGEFLDELGGDPTRGIGT